MKRLLLASGLLLAILGTPAAAQVSVSIGQPGFHGRIDIGGYPPPRLLFPEPVIIHPARAAHAPIYLHVPPGHAKRWHRHCRDYGACGRPVYFVDDGWYRHDYVPRYRERHGYRHDHWHHDDRRGYRGHHDYRHEHRDDRHERRHHRHGD